MTLIEVRNNGTLLGRCDARCYAAKKVTGNCDCVCDSLNHGIGLDGAIDNIPEIAQEYIELGYQVKTAQIQLKLFR